MQQPTPENLKAEMARHRIRRDEVCDLIGMHPNQLSQYVNAARALPAWAAHNIGWAVNVLTRQEVFNVDMRRLPCRPARGRPPGRRVQAEESMPPARFGPEPIWARRARSRLLGTAR